MSIDPIPYFRPAIGREEIDAVVRSLENGWLTTGPKTKALENEFAAACGVKHAIALNSCTAALHVALEAIQVGPGDEVVMPSLSFVAAAQCVRHLGGTPVFCDVDPVTLCATVETIAAAVSDRTKAIIPMHYGGGPAAIDDIVQYAQKNKILVIEDAAHAAGTLINGEWSGARSTAATYSFYATKNITSAEGGMLVTNSDEIMEKARVLALHGMDRDAWKRYTHGGKWQYDVVATGYKYNMPDIAAVIALEQLKKLEAFQRRRGEIADYFRLRVADIRGVRVAGGEVTPPSRHSWCMFVVMVDENETGITRDDLIEELNKRDIGTSVHYIPTHLFSAYRNARRAPLPTTDRVWKQLVSLPLYPSLTDAQAQRVMDALSDIVADRSGRIQIGSPVSKT